MTTKKKKKFSYGQFIEYFIARPIDSDYWEDQISFCRHVLYKCDVCWTCKMFDVAAYSEKSYCTCGKYDKFINEPGKQKCHLFKPKEDEQSTS